eukprot:g34478.t1
MSFSKGKNKGYGFILPDGSEGNGVFCHTNRLIGVRRLDRGQRVEFEIVEDTRGPVAINFLQVISSCMVATRVRLQILPNRNPPPNHDHHTNPSHPSFR